MDGAEDPQEHFLGDVERFFAVAEQVEGKLEDHPLVLHDEFRAGRLVPGGAALDERRFPSAQLRPSLYAYWLEHQVLSHLLPPL